MPRCCCCCCCPQAELEAALTDKRRAEAELRTAQQRAKAQLDAGAIEGGEGAGGGGPGGDVVELDEDALQCTLMLLTGGLVLLKHGRRGFPHKRLVWLDARHADLRLSWGKPEAGIVNADAETVPLSCIKGLQVGMGSAVLKRSGKASSAGLYLTLELRDHRDGSLRTLDLEAESPVQRDWLAEQLGRLLLGVPGLVQACMMHLHDAGVWTPLPPADDFPLSDDGEGGGSDGGGSRDADSSGIVLSPSPPRARAPGAHGTSA